MSGSARSANGHIQATGRDAKGRKQYRYHPAFREVRESTKYEHMLDFAQALPAIRATRSTSTWRLRGLPREKVLATVVHLLETTLIRVGNDDYAKQNKSYGLTTLRDPHVKVDGAELRFQFKGKSGKTWRLQVKDRRVARIVKACQDLPGQDLFQYLDEDGERQTVTSADVNAYLRRSPGGTSPPRISGPGPARCWPPWRCSEFESFDSEAKAKKNIRAAIEQVASRLGNTPTICRKCYVHPEVFTLLSRGPAPARDQGRGRERAARQPRRPEARGGGGADPAGGAPQPGRRGRPGAEPRTDEARRKAARAEPPRRAPERADKARGAR